MKCKTFIGTEHEDEVLIYSNSRTKLVEDIENLVLGENTELVGYIDRDAVKLDVSEIHCFIAEDNKGYALTEKQKLRLRQRIYILEEMLDGNFVKINQSCIANIRQIRKFGVTISGSLNVTFKNGYSDYVSRRNMKKVKERLGI